MPRTRYSKPQYIVEEAPEEDEKVLLMLRKDLTVNVTGAYTGEVYHFIGGGSKLWVDKNDAEVMLKRKTTKTCCGGTSQPYFELIQEGVI